MARVRQTSCKVRQPGPLWHAARFYLNWHGWSLVVTPFGNAGTIALLCGLASHGRTGPIVRFTAFLSRRSARVHWTLQNNERPAMFWTVDCWAGYSGVPCLRVFFSSQPFCHASHWRAQACTYCGHVRPTMIITKQSLGLSRTVHHSKMQVRPSRI